MDISKNIYFALPDYLMIGAIVLFNILYIWKLHKYIHTGWFLQLFLIVIYGVAFPLLSIGYEIDRIMDDVGKNFSFIYTFTRFAIYWLLGLVQTAIISKFELRKQKKIKKLLDEKRKHTHCR